MAMDIRALRYFVEAVRFGSFTHAARALSVTQSTISKMVRQLEDEIGQPLMIREGKEVRLTDVGRIVYDRGLDALAVVQRLRAEVADVAELGRGALTVGIPPMANLFFSAAVSAFRQRYCNVELTLAEHAWHRRSGVGFRPRSSRLRLHHPFRRGNRRGMALCRASLPAPEATGLDDYCVGGWRELGYPRLDDC